jgi:hypothetical protein
MTNRITLAAVEVRVGDHVYNGPAASKHPTYAWETITEVRRVDGLVLLITGHLDTPHGEFWFEAEEAVTVMRYPSEELAVPAGRKPAR